MGETRAAKQQRLNQEAQRMKTAHTMSEAERKAMERQEAYRQGWNDAATGRVGSRDLSPLKNSRLRQIWKDGFDAAQHGLKVKLPPVGLPPRSKADENDAELPEEVSA